MATKRKTTRTQAAKPKVANAEVIESSDSATLVATLPETPVDEAVEDNKLDVEDLAELPSSDVSESEFIAKASETSKETDVEIEVPSQEFEYNDIVTFRNKSGHLRHGVFGKITAMGYEAIELFKTN